MPFSELDTAAVARTLSQIAEKPEDVVDAFFERREEAELPPEDEGPGLREARVLVGGGRLQDLEEARRPPLGSSSSPCSLPPCQ